jgi:hypothetical protein
MFTCFLKTSPELEASMHRIDGAGNDNGQFVAEDPQTHRPPTEITAAIMNALQEEIAGFIEYAGLSLAKSDNTQLRQALLKKFAQADSTIHYIKDVWTIVDDATALAALAGVPTNGEVIVTAYNDIGQALATWNGVSFAVSPLTVNIFDLYGTQADQHGYYWFSGRWNQFDMAAITPPAATEEQAGLIRIATADEAAAGTATDLAITPARLLAFLVARSITAGDGLDGGGTLGQSRTLKLGTPGSLTLDSQNSATGKTHTHALDLPDANATAAGIIALATNAEAWAGTNAAKAITPAALKYAMSLLMPAGIVLWFARNTPPAGYLECNGAALSRTVYAALFAVIGTTFGAGDGATTFNLPDLRGEFVRGWDHGRGVDAGRVFGSGQGDAIRNIAGSFTVEGAKSSGERAWAHSGAFGDVSYGGTYTKAAWDKVGYSTINFNAALVVPTAADNRPINAAFLPCIKY